MAATIDLDGAKQLNLLTRQHSQWRGFQLVFKQPDGTPSDLSGNTYRLDCMKVGSDTVEFSINGMVTDNTVLFELSADDNTQAPGTYRHVVNRINTDGTKIIVYGKLVIRG